MITFFFIPKIVNSNFYDLTNNWFDKSNKLLSNLKEFNLFLIIIETNKSSQRKENLFLLHWFNWLSLTISFPIYWHTHIYLSTNRNMYINIQMWVNHVSFSFRLHNQQYYRSLLSISCQNRTQPNSSNIAFVHTLQCRWSTFECVCMAVSN